MDKKIYVIEDDENICEIISLALKSIGYEVISFNDASSALDKMKLEMPSLAIFDVMLPGMSGLDAIKEIRKHNTTLPILVLSAKDREMDKVVGLDSGSDDYMTKPFGVLELQARVRSLLRRSQPTSNIASTKTLSIDRDKRIVKQYNQEIDLTKKEYQLLIYLIDNSNRVVEREELLEKIWGYDFVGESRALDVHIRSLRSKLNDDGTKYIKTIRSVGYRFIENNDD
ncbi:MAG: response regulator transcription factor [Thomasclavelia sp.]|jgi:two-component system alkaline phosphatase synthesis response regulator PhoP|nr:response regulator transcription factor [Thomasclavelia sp.]